MLVIPEGKGKNQMDISKSSAFDLLDGTIGIPIKIISNDYDEFAGNTRHKIVFQIHEDDPDIYSIGVLFALSLMSFRDTCITSFISIGSYFAATRI